ncbi:MAG TPA: DUF4139 domain-containing protein [Terriglobales bacterium]|nr:DUF4139 domain-containing protein [Terriglobales bacterium]
MRAKTLSALFVGLALLLPARTQAGDDAVTEMKPVSVAAFKNGLAFVIKRGTARLQSGEGRIGFAPAATLGTLWVAPAGEGVSLDELVAYRYERPKSRTAQSVQELFALNVGKTVTVEYSNKEITGEILPLPEEKPEPGAAEAGAVAVPRPAGLLLLKVEGKTVALNASYVNILSFAGEPNTQVTASASLKALRFKLKGAGESADLTMGYLEKGLGWTPSYMISLKDETTAQITLQAVVVNDAEDVAGADLFFVVGVPNFRYADVPSPMALQQSLAEMIGMLSVNGRGSGGPMSNAVMAQRTSADTEYGAVGDFSATVGELVGAPEEDLFLYSKPGVTLAKGERATYNVFTAPVAIEHIYEWEVAASQQLDRYGNPTQQTPDTTENNVWHSLRLTNSSKFPWTSAPALVISGTKPISQDTLLYTPKGAKTNLKLTVATDVRANRQELEVARQPRVLRWNGADYDAVTVEGTLKVRNYKSKAISLHITKTVPGEVLSASDEGKSEKLAEAIRSANPTTRLTWEVTVKPGEEKVITYRYKVMVRS